MGLIVLHVIKQLFQKKMELGKTLRFLKHWSPLILLIFSYENLRNLILLIKDGGNITPSLSQLDLWLFGVQPTVWLQNYVHPLLTDYLAITYAFFFVMPVIVTFELYLRGHLKAYYDMGTGMVLSFYLGFVGYIIFPATPPRFSIYNQYWLQKIPGVFFHFSQKIYDKAATTSYFCAFPSLHVTLSTIALLYAWRYAPLMKTKRLLFWCLLPFVVSLWFSTVYLRHHWTGDIIAGWILAFICFKLSLPITRLWQEKTVKAPVEEPLILTTGPEPEGAN